MLSHLMLCASVLLNFTAALFNQRTTSLLQRNILFGSKPAVVQSIHDRFLTLQAEVILAVALWRFFVQQLLSKC